MRARLHSVLLDGVFRRDPARGAALVAEIDHQCTDGCTDPYPALFDLLHPPGEVGFGTTFRGDEEDRIARRVDQIVDLVGPPAPSSFIDVGCGDGRVGAGLAKAWRVPPTRAIAVDVFDRVADRSAMTYQPMVDGGIRLGDAATELALLLMVLHHETDPGGLLTECRRVVAPGGRLVVRESDVDTADLKLFNLIMEDFYYQVFRRLPGVPNPARHESAEHWRDLLGRTGWFIEREDRPEPGNPFTPIHFVARHAG